MSEPFSEPAMMQSVPGTKPNPDPTTATNAAVDRAMKSERDYVNGKIEVLESRLAGIDTATELRLAQIDHIPAMVDEKVSGLRHLVDERFDSVGTQFDLVERQRVEQKKDTKDAVDAALAAAKEAVKEQTTASGLSINKSETATSEQLKQLTATFTTAIGGVTTSLDDLKERVNRMESFDRGRSDTKVDTRAATDNTLKIWGGIATLVVILLSVFSIYLGTHRSNPTTVCTTTSGITRCQ